MSTSEFRYNKKRKHYAYLFKIVGFRRKNMLISSKPFVIKHKHGRIKIIAKNTKLYKHPNKKKEGVFYIIPFIYLDEISSFGNTVYSEWVFDVNDKRTIKRLKKRKQTK